MSERGEPEEQEVREGEEESAETSPQPGGGTAEQPPEDDGEPGSDGEEVEVESSTAGVLDAEEETDLSDDAEHLEEPQRTEDDGNSAGALETAEEAETQADLPDEAEQLREPQRKENVGNSTATVKVVLVPEGHVMTVAFAIGLSIEELKRHLAAELRVPAEVLQISVDGRAVEEQQSLMELGVRPHGSTRMEMSSADPTTHPLRPLRPPEHDSMPDVITVRIQTDEGVFQEVVVEIERPRQRKAFLGGYRHRLTGTEYHHAAVQTLPKRRPDRAAVVFSRDTQVIRLQAFARRWLARQEVERLRRERGRRLAWLELQERRRKEEKEEQLRDRRQRWRNPQRREDFNLLYHALEKWRHEEEQRINSSLRGAERKAALCSLLEQETQLIASIGRHRIAVHSSNYDKAVRTLLDKSAAPHRWRAADGRLIEMDSQHTLRARELRDLYNSLNQSSVSQDQRVQVLMALKHIAKEHACRLTRDIVDLIDREVDLMTRGVKAASLEGLRKRISTLFLQYIKTPAFNPEVARLLKVPQNPSQLKNDMFLCRGCHRYLQSADFSPTSSARLSGRCRDCTGLDNVARSRDDFSCYENILRRLRAGELQLSEDARIPFLLQVEDMRYLVEEIWASRSALNAGSDLYNLAFVRWDRQRDWSPWNCILLSKEETSAHMEVEDVHKVYEATFIDGIKHKHTLAQRHFSQISVMAEYLDAQPAAAPGNQLVSKPIAMVTGEHATDATPSSAH
ncbi:IQ motif and ubiquitin-like domain-containing protein isoform X2 [Chaetodon trifascialis]|uniref:IQ motif and ubiquitin-like domain-containing protein isoform X2 n=1 Tax=Chaetodon trifascialis TaxID=109706 RepID=UPI00399260AC